MSSNSPKIHYWRYVAFWFIMMMLFIILVMQCGCVTSYYTEDNQVYDTLYQQKDTNMVFTVKYE